MLSDCAATATLGLIEANAQTALFDTIARSMSNEDLLLGTDPRFGVCNKLRTLQDAMTTDPTCASETFFRPSHRPAAGACSTNGTDLIGNFNTMLNNMQTAGMIDLEEKVPIIQQAQGILSAGTAFSADQGLAGLLPIVAPLFPPILRGYAALAMHVSGNDAVCDASNPRNGFVGEIDYV